MKKVIGFLAIALSIVSCSAEPIEIEKPTQSAQIVEVAPIHNTFTVVWESNQEGAYIEFTKHIFKDCKIISTTLETHREKRFEITLDNGQMFDLQIKKEASVKNPELTIKIYKGDLLQYDQTVYSGGFVMSNFVDHNGNIGK